MFLLDTNVVSETIKPRPRAAVLTWLERQAADDLYLSVITLGEIAYGIEKLAPGEKRDRLITWRDKLETETFAGRVLNVTSPITAEWARMEAHEARTTARFDTLLAATARVHGLVIATRNERDFSFLGVRLINPWNA